jgi:hypothetical protein
MFPSQAHTTDNELALQCRLAGSRMRTQKQLHQKSGLSQEMKNLKFEGAVLKKKRTSIFL